MKTLSGASPASKLFGQRPGFTTPCEASRRERSSPWPGLWCTQTDRRPALTAFPFVKLSTRQAVHWRSAGFGRTGPCWRPWPLFAERASARSTGRGRRKRHSRGSMLAVRSTRMATAAIRNSR